MNQKQYQRIKLIIVVVIAMIFSQSIIMRNFFIPVVTLIASSLILLYLRKQVKGVIADERDYATGGRSALLAIQIYAWIAVISMFLLYSLKDNNPAYEPIAMTLAFSTCILMLLYAFIFRYYNKFKNTDKKLIYTAFVLIFFFIMAIFTLRLFSGEDNWMCVNGEWVEHGHPSFPAPETECK